MEITTYRYEFRTGEDVRQDSGAARINSAWHDHACIAPRNTPGSNVKDSTGGNRCYHLGAIRKDEGFQRGKAFGGLWKILTVAVFLSASDVPAYF